ncbi:MAG: 4Fe-4S dicluster domain-containing protein [Eubacteriales bacterium]|nr:4Fe-4S dicluster domain-containing protein [Eubacteriales bacterium]
MEELRLGKYVVGDTSKCTGCKACEVACFAEHNKKTNGVGKTVGTVTIPVTPKLYVTKGDGFCVPIQCKHCEDAPCLNACQKDAICRIDHKVIVDVEKCIGCKDCMMACPFGAISLLPLCKNGKVVAQVGCTDTQLSASKCDLCQGIDGGPACVRVCPNEALRLVEPEKERKEKNIKSAYSLSLTKSFGKEELK